MLANRTSTASNEVSQWSRSMAALRTERIALARALGPSHPSCPLKRDLLRKHATGRPKFSGGVGFCGSRPGPRGASVRRLQQRELGVHRFQHFRAVDLPRFPSGQGRAPIARAASAESPAARLQRAASASASPCSSPTQPPSAAIDKAASAALRPLSGEPVSRNAMRARAMHAYPGGLRQRREVCLHRIGEAQSLCGLPCRRQRQHAQGSDGRRPRIHHARRCQRVHASEMAQRTWAVTTQRADRGCVGSPTRCLRR